MNAFFIPKQASRMHMLREQLYRSAKARRPAKPMTPVPATWRLEAAPVELVAGAEDEVVEPEPEPEPDVLEPEPEPELVLEPEPVPVLVAVDWGMCK